MMNPSQDGVSLEEWSSRRWEGFRTFLQRVRKTNAFQTDHFRGLADCDQWSGFDEFVENCPFTEKNDLALDRQQNPPYGTNLTFPIEEYSCFHQTSGTMGDPMAWLDTEEDWNWMLTNWDRVLGGAGVQAGNRCFFAFSFGPFLGFGLLMMPPVSVVVFVFQGEAKEANKDFIRFSITKSSICSALRPMPCVCPKWPSKRALI